MKGNTMSNELKKLPKLKPAIKRRWLKALRSGKYKQGTGSLRDGDGFCCLGVLCDVVKNDKALKLNWEGGVWFDNSTTDLGCRVTDHVLAPNQNLDELDGDMEALMRRNDGTTDIRRQSFKKIANLIERHC